MKRFLLVIASVILTPSLFANHITGGQIFYTYGGQVGNQYVYNVTLWLYRDHNTIIGAQLDDFAPMAIFDKRTNAMVWTDIVERTDTIHLHLLAPGPCINNPPDVFYEVGRYNFTVFLPATPNGYIIAYQRCCRIAGINNLVSSNSLGATYTAEIPGTNSLSNAPQNNSAHFIGADTVITCAGYPFTYSFAAIDADGDQLVYSFCDAYKGGGQDPGPNGGLNTPTPNPPATPPYINVTYSPPFTGSSPLGSGVTINASTGLISGIVPPAGIYVVTVCVNEIRNGVVIATQRKDLQIKTGQCDLVKAQLDPLYTECGSLDLSFANQPPSNPLINSYSWNFGDPGSGLNNGSDSSTPAHTFSAPGDYSIKLTINRGQSCPDSTTAVVRVWPGFFPNFINDGICLISPVIFHDATITNFGFVNSWSWSFGDPSTIADSSHIQIPSWTYADTGTKTITLIVTNSKGCIDTISKAIHIIDRPAIGLPFRDTLICVPDALQLQALGTGNFSWTPPINITNSNTATPTVNPTITTWYHVQLDQLGCMNNDSVKVRVVNLVTLFARPDSVICLTDSIKLNVVSDALHFIWDPSGTLNNAAIKTPIAKPTDPLTSYHVIARIGSCQGEAWINIRTVPYPLANAGGDDIICYNKSTVLHATHNGTSFSWSPAGSLLHANTLDPTAFPPRTMEYILTVTSNNGCPKPVSDTVLVTVLAKIIPHAGNDTMVVVNQPLQLNASGGIRYQWIPSTGLNNPLIKNPIGIYGAEIDSIRYTLLAFNDAGCFDSAHVTVKVFKTNPHVFVPTAFTPNSDGLNDIVCPIAVGVRQINYFSIYNRWGQLVFRTSINGKGWDGTVQGKAQGSNVYVWMVSAIDYLNKPIFLKGTVTLIR